MKKYIGWFSCGVTSAVACKLALDMYGSERVDLWYIATGAGQPDHQRFIKACENGTKKKLKLPKVINFLVH